MKSFCPFAGAALLVASISGALAAQPTAGSLVLVSEGLLQSPGLMYIDTTTNTLRTAFSRTSLRHVHGRAGNPDGCYAAFTTHIERCTGTGACTTLWTTPIPITDFTPEPAGTGEIAVGTNRVYRLWRTALGQGRITTLFRPTGTWSAITRDLDTGKYVLGDSASGSLVELDLDSGVMSTLATGWGVIWDLEYVPTTGAIAAIRDSSRGLALYQRGSPIVRFTASGGAQALKYDRDNDELVVVASSGAVRRYSTSGTLNRTSVRSGWRFRSVDIWQDRELEIVSGGARGGPATIRVALPRSAGRTMCLAASFGIRPAIQLNGVQLGLRADDLFFLTACKDIPGLTSGFVQTVKATSNLATLEIPAVAPIGLRVYVAAAAVNPQLPGGFDVSNTGLIVVR